MKTFKKKRILFITAMIMILSLTSCGGDEGGSLSGHADSSSQRVSEDTTAAAESDTETEIAGTQAAVSEKVTQSDKLVDYTFTLDGVVYQLPFPWTDLTDNGWTIYGGASEDDNIGANQYTNFAVQKDGKQVYVDVINLSDNEKQLKNCYVGGIEVFGYTENQLDFSIAGGITLDASEEEVREAFGDPVDSNDSDQYVALYYGNSDTNYIRTTICCDKGQDGYSDSYIRIKNYVAVEGED